MIHNKETWRRQGTITNKINGNFGINCQEKTLCKTYKCPQQVVKRVPKQRINLSSGSLYDAPKKR